MMFKTHLMFGFFLGLAAINHFSITPPIIFILLALFFSIFPDIDNHKSKISRELGFLRYLIKFLFQHRHFIHSIFIPATLFLVFVLMHQLLLGFAVVLGYSSHLSLDALNKQGIMPLYPLTKKRIRGFFAVNGIVDYILFFAFLFLSGYLLINRL